MVLDALREKHLKLLAPLAVAALTFAVFLPALKNGFVNWDDLQTLVENQQYRGLGWRQLKWMFTTFHMGHYQPLSWVTFAFDHLIWGMNPLGYHLTSVILHALTALVFYFVCLKLLASGSERARSEGDPGLYLSAAVAALFFAIHPLRVESVAWATERRDVLSGLFYLLAVNFYLKPRLPAGKTGFFRLHILPLAAFLLSLFSKGMGITLPAALILLDIYPLRRLPLSPRRWFTPEFRRIWLEKIPFIIFAAVFAVVGFTATGGAMRSYEAFGPVPRIVHSLFSVWLYVWKTLVPFGLSPLYKLPGSFGLASWPSLLGAAFLTAATAAAVRAGRPALLTAWAYYLVTLGPVAGFVKFGPQSAADRYTYLPCLGFAVLAGAGFHLSRRHPRGLLSNACAALTLLALTGLAFGTWRQQKIWHDSETLWNYALALDPRLDIAHNNLGSYLTSSGEHDRARFHFLEALRINPDYAGAYYNLAWELAEAGKSGPAAGYYREALRLDPGFAMAAYNLGLLSEQAGLPAGRQGRFDQARYYYREALRIDPDYAQAYYNLGTLLAGRGEADKAVECYRQALRINPDYADAHANLCVVLAARGELREGVKHCAAALSIDPAHKNAHYNLALALTGMGKPEEAARHYREALKIDPFFSQARRNLDMLIAGQVRKPRAR